MFTELETGGNIRFEEGRPLDKWHQSVIDLVKSRFATPTLSQFGIKGLSVQKVTRIHNRFLKNRFDERLEQQIDLSDNGYKRNLEYLFFGIDPEYPNEMFRVMEDGFRTPEEYEQIEMPPYPGLVNSVASADTARIKAFFEDEKGSAHIRSAAKQKSKGF